MPGRNDPCPCGSGKKYKKCCLDKDAARVAEVNDSSIDSYRPAALPVSANRFAPAIACMRDEPEACVCVLIRASRPLPLEAAIGEADRDIESSPGTSDEYVGPGCVRYLDKIGYRKTDVDFENLKFETPGHDDSDPDQEICPHCGERHLHELDFDEEYPGDEEPEDSPDQTVDDDFLAEDVQQATAFIQRLAAVPPGLLRRAEVQATTASLIEEGHELEFALVQVLEAVLDEAEKMKEMGEFEPNDERFIAALKALLT